MSGAGAVVGVRGFEPEFQRVFCTDVVKASSGAEDTVCQGYCSLFVVVM